MRNGLFRCKVAYMYMTENWNYEFLNTGTRLNAHGTLYRWLYYLELHYLLTSGLQKIIQSEQVAGSMQDGGE